MCDNNNCSNGIIGYTEEYPLEFGGMKRVHKSFKCPNCEKKKTNSNSVIESFLHEKISEAVKIHQGINCPGYDEKDLRNSLLRIVTTFGYELK